MDVALRALNRFGLGARRGERQRISDPRGWLKAQLDGGAPSLHPSDIPPPGAIGDAVRGLRPPGQKDEQERREARRHLVELSAGEARTHSKRASPAIAPLSSGSWPSGRITCACLRARNPCRAARRIVRPRRHPSARAGTIRRHGPRIGEAPRDARVPRQLSIDRTIVARRAHGTAQHRREARPERKLRARTAGAAHTRRQRRLHASRCAGARADSHRLDDRRDRRAWCARARCSTATCQWRDPPRPAGAWKCDRLHLPRDAARAGYEDRAHSNTRKTALPRASTQSAHCAGIRPLRNLSRRSWRHISSATTRRRRQSIAWRVRFVRARAI